MPADVPNVDPGTLGYAAVRSGAPVRGVTWGAVANAINFLNGTPRALIPHCAPQAFLATLDGLQTLRFKAWTSYQATHRLWLATLAPDAQDEAIGTEFEFTDPSGVTATWRASGTLSPASPQPFVHIEEISVRLSGETVLAPTVESITGNHNLDSIACFELARPQLALDADDLGLELRSFDPGHWIYDATGFSLGALPEALADALSFRRHLLQFAVPSASAAAITGTGTALLPYSPTLTERFLYSGETQVEVDVFVYTRSDAATTGTVDFVMTSGDTLSIAVTASDAGTWRTGVISVDAEDLATATGWRGSTPDRCTITASRTAGAGAIYVDSITIVGRAG